VSRLEFYSVVAEWAHVSRLEFYSIVAEWAHVLSFGKNVSCS
jgi:hypothetical protein